MGSKTQPPSWTYVAWPVPGGQPARYVIGPAAASDVMHAGSVLFLLPSMAGYRAAACSALRAPRTSTLTRTRALAVDVSERAVATGDAERRRRWKRPRQHVNPLAQHHQNPLELADAWDAESFDAARPLHVDIGCAAGHFCVGYADRRPDINVLGVEIRQILVDRANSWADAREHHNLRFLAGNANVDLPTILRASRSPLASCSIQFPDPWFKKRHHKRRVVQPALVDCLAEHLPPGGFVFVQSDVLELAEAMTEQLDACPRLARDEGAAGTGWLPDNPLGVPTEREIATARKGGDVWRAMYTRRPDDGH